jgi:periplasmic protein TonB
VRGSVLGSGLVHLALLVVLLVVRASAPVIIPGPDVVQVALVDAPTMTIPATPPPPPKPEVEAGEIAPTEDEGVKLEKPKKPSEKKAEEKKPDKPPPATTTTALPSAPVGNAGLKGDISLDAGDFEFTYYLLLVRNRIAGNWAPPAGLTSSTNCRAVVYFKIARNGQVTDMRVETSSGVEYFDRSTLRAVTLSNPLPPLPLGYTGGRLGVHFGFEYTGP